MELDSGSGQTESDRDVPREGVGGRRERGDKMAGGQRRGELLFVCLLSIVKRKITVSQCHFYILTFFLCSQMEVLIGNLSSSPYTISVSSKDCPRDLTQTNLLSFPPLPPLSFFFPCAFLPYSLFSSLPSPRCGDMSVVVI